ncbi:hypothetical protein SAMN04515695_3037 [Pseudovibrio sp. Tun.PSC04-5.I4]|nr:hypothetical protein SAMN04515695_3037 [Pseudovibrio sp. Tun.PSC04-5.I4]
MRTESDLVDLLPEFTGAPGEANALSIYLDVAISLCESNEEKITAADWELVSQQIAINIKELLEFSVVQNDPHALKLIARLISSRNFVDFIQSYDAIAAHYTLLLNAQKNEQEAAQSSVAKPQRNAGRTRLIL